MDRDTLFREAQQFFKKNLTCVLHTHHHLKFARESTRSILLTLKSTHTYVRGALGFTEKNLKSCILGCTEISI